MIISEEEKNVSVIPVIKNEVDDPQNLSVSSVAPLPEAADEITETEEEKEETVASETEKKEETSEETLQENIEQPKNRESDAVQRRFNELTKLRREAERGLEYERKKRIELEEELSKVKRTMPQGSSEGKPKIDDFEDDADYYEALTEWKIEAKLKAKDEEMSRATKQANEKAGIDRIYQELNGKIEKGSAKYADFNELVLNENLKFSDAMVESILMSDTAEDILYYLGKHPEESAVIAKFPPLKVAHELGKIEARLNVPRKKLTRTPDPISPVNAIGVTDKDPANMTPREYRAWREKDK